MCEPGRDGRVFGSSLTRRNDASSPLRAIRALVDDVLRDMSREFDGLYAGVRRPSIPPERLLRAQLLQILSSTRSERLFMEQVDYNLLFRWFVGMDMDEPIPDGLYEESRSAAESGYRCRRGKDQPGSENERHANRRRRERPL